ncbi:MAG TPA: TlpA disulfide reductase family protein [Pedobacter sp.]|uniref:TlpA disulfide reductase family protein n=1 Tax=Pedobacter sp. TaxID=1411316 RepID=UPI002B802EF8|nr:TlpA disulfide reductase family protein [Pedobacter sp.]HMI02281.1 TlpA disulfide reductase family protein [Pedobacter sp.]
MKVFYALVLLAVVSSKLLAQDVQLLTVDQLNKRLENGKDTVYMVNLWATWCIPCVKELPSFEKLKKTYYNAPLKVLLISLDFKSKLESEVKPFLRKMKLANEVFVLNERDQQVYIEKVDKNWSGTIPATLVVNRARNRRQLFPKELTYTELINIYNINK